jgi:pyrroline-5-carboxylate reductase
MKESNTIAIIGPGVMAEAMISGMLRRGVATADHILASGPELDRNQELCERYSIRTMNDNPAAVQQAQVVILSVKPQLVQRVMNGLKNKVNSGSLVISIVAGTSIGTICESLNHDMVVRSMPNTPGQIGEGITVWTHSPSVTSDQVEITRRILGALGIEVLVEEENYLDMATALSGTGPAYVYLFMEAMIDAGVHLGFSRKLAEQLVTQTLLGSVEYYKAKGVHVARLRNDVTSPGGTTAEALYFLEKAGFRTAMSRAIWAAYERSKELGAGRNSHPPEKKDLD